jgi:hypothetical protein
MNLCEDGAVSVALALALDDVLDLEVVLAMNFDLVLLDDLDCVPYSAGAERILIDPCVLLGTSFF